MSYESAVLARSPALYVPANNGTLTDASGNGHDGSTSSGLIGLAGGAGALAGETAVRFAAGATSSDAIVLASPATIPHVAPYTVEFWCKFENSGGEFDEFKLELTLPTGHPSGAGWLRVFAQETPDPSIGLVAWINDSGAASAHEFSAGPLADHPFCWHYYAFTYDGTTLRYYQDAVLQRTLVEAAGMFSSTQVPSAASLYADGPMSVPLSVNHVAVYPTRLSDADIAANYAAATPRQDAGCFGLPIRLRHSSGHVVFESTDEATTLRAMDQDALTHDGTTMSVYGGGVERLRVPLPSAPSPPSRWVGIDPAGGLAVHDILPVTATHSIAPVVPPTAPATTPTTCDQMRCGAAVNMTGHLISLYQHWAGVLNPLSSLALKFGVGAAIAAGGELILSAFAIEEIAGAIFESITSKLTSLLSAAAINIFASPTPDEQNVVQNGAYCALTCEGNVINPTAAQIQAWSLYLTNNSSAFSSLNMELALFSALLQFTPLLDWQLQAQSATPSASCGTMTCP